MVQRQRKEERLASGPACWLCAMTASKGFPMFSWSEVVTRAKSNAVFADMLYSERRRNSLSCLRTTLTKIGWGEDVYEHVVTARKLQRSMLFLSTGGVRSSTLDIRYNQLNSSDLTLEEVMDESGQKQQGICIMDPKEPFRRLVWWRPHPPWTCPGSLQAALRCCVRTRTRNCMATFGQRSRIDAASSSRTP